MWIADDRRASIACIFIATTGMLAALVARLATPATMTHSTIMNAATVYVCGALLWPFVWSKVCGGSSAVQLPAWAFIGLAWPPLLLALDVAFAQHHADEDVSKSAYGMQVDGNTLSGLALALGGVLVRHVSSGYATAAGPMLMASVLLVLLLVAPSPVLHARSAHAATMRAVQRVALQWCLGFSITAVALAFGVGMRMHSHRQTDELQKALNGGHEGGTDGDDDRTPRHG